MTATETSAAATTLRTRFAAFVAERHPFALAPALAAFDRAGGGDAEAMPGPLRAALEQTLRDALATGIQIPETTPRVPAAERLRAAIAEVVEACDGFLRREAIAASLTGDERRR